MLTCDNGPGTRRARRHGPDHPITPTTPSTPPLQVRHDLIRVAGLRMAMVLVLVVVLVVLVVVVDPTGGP